MSLVTHIEADHGLARKEVSEILTDMVKKGTILWFGIEDSTLDEWEEFEKKYNPAYDASVYEYTREECHMRFRKIVYMTSEPFASFSHV